MRGGGCKGVSLDFCLLFMFLLFTFCLFGNFVCVVMGFFFGGGGLRV